MASETAKTFQKCGKEVQLLETNLGKPVSRWADWNAHCIASVRAKERTNLLASETTCTKCPQNKLVLVCISPVTYHHMIAYNMLQNYIANCIPCPLLHNIFLPVAMVLLETFLFKLLFKLQTPTEIIKFSTAICVNCSVTVMEKKKKKKPQNRNQLYPSMYSSMYNFP